MIQHIALTFNPPHLLPHDAHRAHFPVAKGARLGPAHKGHLFQFDGFAFVVWSAAIAAEGEDGEAGPVT